VSVPQPRYAAEAFNFGKKKNDGGDAAGDGAKATDGKASETRSDKDSAEGGDQGGKGKLKGNAEKSEEPPKEKHMSKEESRKKKSWRRSMPPT